MRGLSETARLHWNYSGEDIAALRGLVRRAHRERGIPELRLWTLPHRGGHPYRVCVSIRFDVDKAIVNMPLIYELEAKYGLRSTAYMRPMGFFYGSREIRRCKSGAGGNEIALHGEFVTTARERFGDEFKAAIGEKELLESIIGEEVAGVCMHGGEFTTNITAQTRAAIETARFKYETMYRNQYYLPLHLPNGDGVMRTLSIGQHFADLNIKPGRTFVDELTKALVDKFSEAASVGGVFVPVKTGRTVPRRPAPSVPIVQIRANRHLSNGAARVTIILETRGCGRGSGMREARTPFTAARGVEPPCFEEYRPA